MSEPVVFISHFAVKEGKLDDLRRLSAEVETQLRAHKPGTVAYLMYLDEEGTRFTVAHCFPDADAMDHHFEDRTSDPRRCSSSWSPAGGRSTVGPTTEPWR